MKKRFGSLALILLLAACVSNGDAQRAKAIYDKYDAHCREHAREMVGEADEQTRYEECMNYFVKSDVHCPICAVDPHLIKSKQ